jgi:hypothetical protein
MFLQCYKTVLGFEVVTLTYSLHPVISDDAVYCLCRTQSSSHRLLCSALCRFIIRCFFRPLTLSHFMYVLFSHVSVCGGSSQIVSPTWILSLSGAFLFSGRLYPAISLASVFSCLWCRNCIHSHISVNDITSISCSFKYTFLDIILRMFFWIICYIFVSNSNTT